MLTVQSGLKKMVENGIKDLHKPCILLEIISNLHKKTKIINGFEIFYKCCQGRCHFEYLMRF